MQQSLSIDLGIEDSMGPRLRGGDAIDRSPSQEDTIDCAPGKEFTLL
jgi:hypothetical protein